MRLPPIIYPTAPATHRSYREPVHLWIHQRPDDFPDDFPDQFPFLADGYLINDRGQQNQDGRQENTETDCHSKAILPH